MYLINNNDSFMKSKQLLLFAFDLLLDDILQQLLTVQLALR